MPEALSDVDQYKTQLNADIVAVFDKLTALIESEEQNLFPRQSLFTARAFVNASRSALRLDR